jgi:capsular polysaccharide export protein
MRRARPVSTGRRPADDDAILGVLADGLPGIVFEGEAPDAALKQRAAAEGAVLIGLSPAPLRIGALDALGRPLGYRLRRFLADGSELPVEPADPVSDMAERLAAIAALPGFAALDGAVRLPQDEAEHAELHRCFWLDPHDRTPVGLDEALDHASDFATWLIHDAAPAVGLNITIGKRRHLPPFVAFPLPRFRQFSRLDPALAEAKRQKARLIVWASWRHEKAEAASAAAGVNLVRVEDGFLRSVGLGAAFTRSMSLVADSRGIYYDPSRPSDLEHILQTADMDERLIARAARLREAVVAANLTKYNVGPSAAGRLVPEGRVGVLVPGQVEDDASILRGASAVRTNLALIQAARARWPDAFILYKPHPDVEAGYRVGKVADSEALKHVDRVVRDRSIADLFAECSAIETMTSLAGFEGLLRGLTVATHGQPFYAGWGLTTDLAPNSRRTRQRSLDELVAAALILYPRYVDPVSCLPCGPEVVLRRLAEARTRAEAPAARAGQQMRHALALFRHRVLGPLLRRLT